MSQQFTLQGINVNVYFKPIKNMYLRVKAPDGRVEISAPRQMGMRRIRAFTLTKLDWIKQRQAKLKAQLEENEKHFIDGELHQIWGQSYPLQNVLSARRRSIELEGDILQIHAPANADMDMKSGILEKWYRQQVRAEALPLIAQWEARMGLCVDRMYVRRMKSLWGSCNIKKRSIRLNTELAKRDLASLEYLVVHEMTHLLEASHNQRFYALMDSFLPNWKMIRKGLNDQRLDIY